METNFHFFYSDLWLEYRRCRSWGSTGSFKITGQLLYKRYWSPYSMDFEFISWIFTSVSPEEGLAFFFLTLVTWNMYVRNKIEEDS